MSDLIASSDVTAIIGMGQTGMSVARFLTAKQQKFMMLDTRTQPPNREVFQKDFPGVLCEFGPLKSATLSAVSKIVVSPGVDIKESAIQTAIANEIPVLGDIQLLAENAEAPIIAITGSNGKSTVTTLVGEMLAQAGKSVAVGGNIGKPALDILIENDRRDYYVLELSSFQLETTDKLNAEVAVILNVTEDHMDRYANFQDYHRAKQRIFYGAKKIVINRQDVLTQPPINQNLQVISFGLNKPDLKQFGVLEEQGETYLAYGLEKLLNAKVLKLRGRHNLANALAALAIGKAIDLPMDAMLTALRQFGGLPHRCQWLRELQGVEYFNDSKGTNVGATLAAISGLAQHEQKIVLIAGGDGKGASFFPLQPVFAKHLRALVAIGRDADQLIAVAKNAKVDSCKAKLLTDAVLRARELAKAGDIVLLSPACASFDMFENYLDRGKQFMRAVEGLAA